MHSAAKMALLSGGAATSPALCTFQTSAVSGANASSYTFNTQAIGAASLDRYVIVAVHAALSGTVNSVTVAGQSCSLFNAQINLNSRVVFAVTDAPVTSGTTATIVVNLSGTAGRAGIGVYSVTGLLSITPTDNDSTTADNTGVTVDVSADGFVIGALMNASTASTHTWTNVTENYDQTMESGNQVQSGGNASTPATTTLTVTADGSAVTNFQVIVSSWR